MGLLDIFKRPAKPQPRVVTQAERKMVLDAFNAELAAEKAAKKPTKVKDSAPETPAADPQKEHIRDVTIELLTQLGHKKQEAVHLVDSALTAMPDLDTAEDLLREVYKIKGAS